MAWLFKASANLINKPVRPSRPAIGLLSETWSPAAMLSSVNLAKASPST